MRKSILIALALALLAVTAYGALGDLVASFPAIGTSTHYGLAADGNYLYHFYYYSTYRYPTIRMRRSNGSFVSSWANPLGTGSGQYYIRGLSYDGLGYLYYNNYSQRRVGRARASNGAMVSSWTWPTTMGYRYGLCVNHNGTSGGTNIYQSYYTGIWYRSTLTGSLQRQWRTGCNDYAYDMAWDYGNKMIWYGNYSTEFVYGCNTNGSIIKSFGIPTTVTDPYGIAYWGGRLYVATTGGTPNEHIWVYDCPATVGVAPASVGRVKALFK